MEGSLNVIGRCPYCHRDVSEDLRPINRSRVRVIENLAQAEAGSPSASRTSASSGASANSYPAGEDAATHLENTLMGLLEHEFNRTPDVPSEMTDDHAAVLASILREEEHRYQEIVNKRFNGSSKGFPS